MESKPLITLCVLAYNRPKDLENTIKSFLWQDYKNSEMVIIDDKSPKNLRKTVEKWIKKDKRIRYIRNSKNLGLAGNFYNSFKHCKGKYVIFLGDDDVFISPKSLEKYVQGFKKLKIGVIRSRQIIIREHKVYQVSTIENKGIPQIFKKGYESYENFLMDSASIAGLAFLNNSKLKKLISNNITMYPQLELAAKMCLFYDTSTINTYLIGVGSGDEQLNVISYKLNGFRTNILDDLLSIYDRTKPLAEKNDIKIINRKKTINIITNFLPLFLPYNILKNGKRNTLGFILKMYSYDKKIIKRPILFFSLFLILLPRLFINRFLKFINKIKLSKMLKKEYIDNFNKNLLKINNFPN